MKYNTLFLDIETAPGYESKEQMSDTMQQLWQRKVEAMGWDKDEDGNPTDPTETFHETGLYAEFGRIVCISVGFINTKEGGDSIVLKSYYGEDEKQLLTDFATMLTQADDSSNRQLKLCGHNAKSFDFPYIAKRMVINGVKVPNILDTLDKKPWETGLIDTMEMWRFGEYKGGAQLKLLCEIFGISTPKDDIDGSMVARVFYEEKNYDRIAVYCEKDVRATIQVYLRIKGLPTIEDTQVESRTFTEERIKEIMNEAKE